MVTKAPIGAVASNQPQVGIDNFYDKTFANKTDRIEVDIPRNHVLSALYFVIDFDIVTTGSSLTGTKHTEGEAAGIAKITVKGNGDDEILAARGPVLRNRSFYRTGELPKQSGLATTMPATAGTQTARVHIPINFMDRRSTTPHATDFDPRSLSQFLAVVEMQTVAQTLYPDFGGTTPTIELQNIRVRVVAEQVLNPIAGVHAAFESKFVRTGDIVLTASDPNNVYDAPRGISLHSWYFQALEETGSGTGYYQPSNNVFGNTWEFKAGNTSIRKWDESIRREIQEQLLTQIAGNATVEVLPTGLVVLEASPLDRELAQNINIDDASLTRMIMDLTKGSNGTKVEVYYEATKQIFFAAETPAA